MSNIITVETDNNEYVSVYKDESGKVVLHIGMYEAALSNKQVENLIRALKDVKVNG